MLFEKKRNDPTVSYLVRGGGLAERKPRKKEK